ncbi:hypothetical protein BG015_005572 [Linnemannia schmuckeri]|uniref:F-box domain-containing protein n=1 Tax=Linnemannia schmuckeri TaxID=64567 RepID=A0A9P5S0U4_9FUNG|nr:hypothetical protein BG015_005572 [Linnemannia schmuckeri]
MTSGQHSHSVVDRIPTELLLAIGQFLDGTSLVDSLQVCRQWYHTLQPLVWFTISEYQWHLKSFPIQPDINPSRDLALFSHLPLVRQIAWAENNIISSKKGSKIVLNRQFSVARLVWLLQRTPNLAILSLRRYCDGFSPVFYQTLTDLLNLRRLHIQVAFPKTRIPIENMFSLFSRLDELHLAGSWYTHEKSTEPLSPSEKTVTPWRLKSLKCTRLDLALTQYCPNLIFFEMHSFEHRVGIPPVSLRFLLKCPKLKTVKLPSYTRPDDLVDMVETFRSLKALRSLFFNVHLREELEFLCAPDFRSDKVQQSTNPCSSSHPLSAPEPDQEPLSVPLLEHLHIGQITVGVGREDSFRMLRNILKTRVNLKSFRMTGGPIDPTQLFAQPGQETHDSWGCKDLRSLSFSLPGSMYVRTQEEQTLFWSPIYRQIGQLPKLQSLTIICFTVQKDKSCGIHQLAGATSLRWLVLRGCEAAEWMREEILDLVSALPKLENLQLKPLRKGNFPQIKSWLCEAGRSDIIFGEQWECKQSGVDIARCDRNDYHIRYPDLF